MPIWELATDLADDELHLIVFGPGYGESAAVRIPPADWLVLDSLAARRARTTFVPAVELLRARGETAAAVVLTHPHDDHAAGLDRLVSSFTHGPVGVLDIYLPQPGFTEQPDGAAVLAASNRTKALQAIATYWDEHPEHEWRLVADDQPRPVGAGFVEVLHPNADFVAAGTPDPSAAPNRYSTPVLVVWEQTRVVLGADLPTAEWDALLAEARVPPVSDHVALKVPHHASIGALCQHLCLVAQADSLAAIAPWNRGRKILPRLEPGGGVEWLLGRRSAVFLTSLGRSLARRVSSDAGRAELESAVERRELLDGVVKEGRADANPDESWVAFSFRGDGTPAGVRLGTESRRIPAAERQTTAA